MSWWADPVGSKPGRGKSSRAKPERGKVVETTKRERCPVCRKTSGCRCAMPDMTPNKGRVKVEGKDGRTRTVTKRTGTSTDARGIEWCDVCKMRCHNGVCMNVQCSTRR